ncbi:MAG TPA: cupredoxin domain-containing protein [Acidimicrobiales bacterium]|nr:cupredoxin domain-containing protein [Acidimicrobiales bacterium]
MRARLLLLIALAFPVLAACGTDSDSGSASDTTVAAATSTTAAAGGITIKGFKFAPTPLSAKVGDTITVTNEDGTNHSVTADDGSFDTDKFSTGNKTIKVEKAGTVNYHCKVHDYMKGVIQVG